MYSPHTKLFRGKPGRYCEIRTAAARSIWPKEKYKMPIPPVQVRFNECTGCQVCARVCTKLTWDAIRMIPTDTFEEKYNIKID